MHSRTAQFTAAERHALVLQQHQSGLSAAAFCREHELVYQTFVGWRRRLAGGGDLDAAVASPPPVPSRSAALPDFIEIAASEPTGTRTTTGTDLPWLVELDLGGGMTLRVRQGR